MKETQILRGLGKARAMYAAGMVPEERPSVGSRMLGKMTGGMFGTAPPTPNVAAAPVQPMQQTMQAPIAQRAVTGMGGGIGNAANAMANRRRQLEQAAGFKDGYMPGAETDLLTEGSYLDENNVIQGPGDGTSDSIEANVSRDEAILPAATVQAVGPQNLARLIEQTNGEQPKRGLSAGYATGFVGETVDKLKNKFNSLRGNATTPVTPTVTPLATGGATTPVSSVTGAGQDAVNSRTRINNPTGAPAASAGPGFVERAMKRVPGRGAPGVVGNATKAVGNFGLKAAGRLAAPVAFGAEVNEVGGTMLDPNKSAGQKVGAAAQSVGKLATAGLGAGLGAEAGATAGAALAPFTAGASLPILTAVGGLAGGAAGYFGGEKLINEGRDLLGIDDPNAGSKTLLEMSKNNDAVMPPVEQQQQTGQVNAGTISAPQQVAAAAQPVVANGSRGGLAAGQAQVAASPYDEQRALLARASRAYARGDRAGEIEAGELRTQARLLGKSIDNEQTQVTARSGQKTNQALADELKLSADRRAEVAAGEKSSGEFQKRITEMYPDTGSGDKKVDNSSKRAEITNMMATTVANLPAEDQAKLFNDATGQTKGVEGLDAKARQRLLTNYKVRERVIQATQGLAGIGNQEGMLSDNLMDYDLASATRVGDTVILKNGAQIQIGDLQFDEGPANPLIPDALFKTKTSRYTSNLRDAKNTER